MKTIVLVTCVQEKQNHPCSAQEMYTSDLFKTNLARAKTLKGDHLFILSGKYGLVSLEEEIEPYDVNLDVATDNELRVWAQKVIEKLRNYSDLKVDQVVIFASKNYRKFLVEQMTNVVEIPIIE